MSVSEWVEYGEWATRHDSPSCYLIGYDTVRDTWRDVARFHVFDEAIVRHVAALLNAERP